MIIMYEQVKAVVMSTVRYSDRTNIVHAYTDTRGRVAFAVGTGNGRSARERRALLMPLSLVEAQVRFVPGKELATMRDLRCLHPLTSIYADPAKNTIALFMSELMSRVIQEQERNEPLFRYIEASVLRLDLAQRGVANFHLCFLYHLGTFIGIQPDVSTYESGASFDMDGGVFTRLPEPGHHILQPDEAEVIKLLSRMTFDNMHLFRFNRQQRNRMLDTILAYYKMHHSTLGNLRSHEVLKQLFV